MIEVKHLTRRFGSKVAVDDISFSAAKGQVLGFLGPNGAGKTTTMRVITGCVEASAGTVSVMGFDLGSQARQAKSLTGYLPENSPLYRDMRVRPFLRFAAALRGISGKAAETAIDRVAELCSLADVLGQSLDTLSKGYARRVCLAQALVHDPPVLVLDEPTDGLDPNQKRLARRLIRDMAADKTIILSTHILEEVEACCDRAVVIAGGKIVADQTPAELKARAKNAGTIVLSFAGADLDDALLALRLLPGVHTVSHEGISFRIVPDDVATATSSVAALATNNGWKLAALTLDEGRLDDVFRDITGEDA